MTDGLKETHRTAIVNLLRANGRVERAVLFGSRAMRTFTRGSDVDIALFGESLTNSDQARLAAAMDELTVPQRVDLLLYDSIEDGALRKHIQRDGIELYRRQGSATPTDLDLPERDYPMLVSLLREHLPGVEAWAYGSRVNRTSRPESDLEMVVFSTPEQAREVSELRESFEGSDLSFRVNLFVWDDVPESFREGIERDHVVLAESRRNWRRSAHTGEHAAPEGWRRSSIFSLAHWKNGLAFKNIDFAEVGRPIIKIAELKAGVTSQTARTMGDYGPSVSVRLGDMLFSWSGNPDTSIDVFRWEGENGWLNQHIFKVTPCDGVSEDFLFFLLKWLKPKFTEIARNKQTTGLGHVTIRDLKQTYVSVPGTKEQAEIVSVIGPIQHKIDLNRRMNETLEAMARTIFRDWFVDFGPTRAKAEGRAPYLAPELWKLFPDALDNEDKPVGWSRLPLDKIADFLNGLALQKFPALDPDDSLPVIKIAELRAGITSKSSRASHDVPDKYVVRDGDFLFSWSGSLLAKFWTEGDGALNQHLFKVTSEKFPTWFFSQWVYHHLEEFRAIAASKATTMGHIQRRHLKEATVICPPDHVLSLLGQSVSPLVERTIKNKLENRTLAQTRDLLLPKLMSGEIRLQDAEKAVGAVA